MNSKGVEPWPGYEQVDRLVQEAIAERNAYLAKWVKNGLRRIAALAGELGGRQQRSPGKTASA